VSRPQKIFYFLYQMVTFYAFPVIFIDTVTFKKGTLIKRVGVRTPWTPLDPPLCFSIRVFLHYYITYYRIKQRQFFGLYGRQTLGYLLVLDGGKIDEARLTHRPVFAEVIIRTQVRLTKNCSHVPLCVHLCYNTTQTHFTTKYGQNVT